MKKEQLIRLLDNKVANAVSKYVSDTSRAINVMMGAWNIDICEMANILGITPEILRYYLRDDCEFIDFTTILKVNYLSFNLFDFPGWALSESEKNEIMSTFHNINNKVNDIALGSLVDNGKITLNDTPFSILEKLCGGYVNITDNEQEEPDNFCVNLDQEVHDDCCVNLDQEVHDNCCAHLGQKVHDNCCTNNDKGKHFGEFLGLTCNYENGKFVYQMNLSGMEPKKFEIDLDTMSGKSLSDIVGLVRDEFMKVIG